MAADSKYSIREKLKVLAVFALGYGVFYIFPNFYASWKPSQLPLTWIDHSIPFLPWTFLIYTSDYLLILLTVLIIQDKDSFLSFSRTMFCTLFICGIFFISFPTTYPRPPYPVLNSVIIQGAMDLVYLADSPNNCFPSMHVALTSVATWNLRNRDSRLFTVFVIWTLAVIASTLTTKQHYLADVIGGLSAVVVVIVAETKLFSLWVKKSSNCAKTVG
jgi:membrane-associated phospholipid phosphatase